VEKLLNETNNTFLENLNLVLERGEKISDLNAKELTIETNKIKIKTKKMNRSFWDIFGCVGAGVC